jgi:hypothetical protein
VNDDGSTANGSSLIDEIVREGARRMLAAALEAEVNAYIAELADRRDERGHRLVVREVSRSWRVGPLRVGRRRAGAGASRAMTSASWVDHLPDQY